MCEHSLRSHSTFGVKISNRLHTLACTQTLVFQITTSAQSVFADLELISLLTDAVLLVLFLSEFAQLLKKLHF